MDGSYQGAPLPHMLLQPPAARGQRATSLPHGAPRPIPHMPGPTPHPHTHAPAHPHIGSPVFYGSPPMSWPGFGPMQPGQYMPQGHPSGPYPTALHASQGIMMMPHYVPGQMHGPPFLLSMGPGSPPQGTHNVLHIHAANLFDDPSTCGHCRSLD